MSRVGSFASWSSAATSTSSCCPATSPLASVPANVVLKAFTTGTPSGSLAAISCAADESDGVTSRSNEAQSTGLVMSTTTLPVRSPPRFATKSRAPSYGVASTTILPSMASSVPPPVAPCLAQRRAWLRDQRWERGSATDSSRLRAAYRYHDACCLRRQSLPAPSHCSTGTDASIDDPTLGSSLCPRASTPELRPAECYTTVTPVDVDAVTT